jgi:hypothetical protein
MTRHPEPANADIPAPVPGAARYGYRLNNGIFEIRMHPVGGPPSVIDTKGSMAAAIRACIRWQKRENIAVSK